MKSKSLSVVVKTLTGPNPLALENYDLPPLDNLIEVKVEYGGLNFADLYTQKGLLGQKVPFVLGIECVGIISDIGKVETDLKIGQRVICYDYQGGLYRDLIRIPKDKCFAIPNGVKSEEAAAVFVNYLTAYFALIMQGALRKNENVLILSAAGGVGYSATQLAKTVEGVKIFGVISKNEDKQSFIKENGVDVVLYNENLENEIKEKCVEGFDVILCNQTDPLFSFLQNWLKPLGRIVLLGANNLLKNDNLLPSPPINISARDLTMNNTVVCGLHLGTLMAKDRKKIEEALDFIFGLLQTGELKPKIYKTLPMKDVHKAISFLSERKNIGKVLISMK